MQYGSYPKFVAHPGMTDAGFASAIALEATVGAKFAMTAFEPITVTRFGILVTVTFNYDTLTTAGVIKLYKYPVNAGTNKVELGSMTLVNAWAAENVYYVDVSNLGGKADIPAGWQVVIEATTQAAGGGSIAGDYQPFVCYHPRAEVVGNQAKMHNVTP